MPPDGSFKIIDFGIAFDMAPEQIKGRRGDARSDIYSLGIILYEMITGEVPFRADNVYAEMRQTAQDDPTLPRRLRPELSPQLEEIILHALERDPDDRFANALEFREALAHPEAVVSMNRARRPRPRRQLPRGVRALLWTGIGVIVYGLIFWTFSHIGARLEERRPSPSAPSSAAPPTGEASRDLRKPPIQVS